MLQLKQPMESPLSGNTAEYTDHNLAFQVNKAYTIQVSADDPDSKCSTGYHIAKIFSEK
jgi:hypothetical protein